MVATPKIECCIENSLNGQTPNVQKRPISILRQLDGNFKAQIDYQDLIIIVMQLSQQWVHKLLFQLSVYLHHEYNTIWYGHKLKTWRISILNWTTLVNLCMEHKWLCGILYIFFSLHNNLHPLWSPSRNCFSKRSLQKGIAKSNPRNMEASSINELSASFRFVEDVLLGILIWASENYTLLVFNLYPNLHLL